MAYQFGHVQWAARVRSKKQFSVEHNGMKTRDVGWSAQDLADEAERMPHACEHVESPQPPTLVYGVMPSQAVAEATAWGDQATEGGDKRRTKLRSTSPVIAAGVISLPSAMMDAWPAYRDEAVEALKERYGDRLRSVVEHLDEAHPHMHFYLVPKPGESFGAVHEGYQARNAERKKGPGAKVRTAYQDAMKGWQDWLHERVSSRFGLLRLGPKRERLSRQEYKRQQDLAKAQAELEAAERIRREAEKDHQAIIALQEEVRTGLATIEQQQAELAGELRDIRRERRELERQKEALTEEQQQQKADLDAREEALKADRAGLKRAFAEARTEGRKKGIEEAAAVSIGKKIGWALGVMREHIGETAKERELRERAEREEAEKARIAREAAEVKKRAKALEGSVGTLTSALERERAEKEAMRREWGTESSDQARRIRELEQKLEAAHEKNDIKEVVARRLR